MRVLINRWLQPLGHPNLFQDKNVAKFALRLMVRGMILADAMVVLVHLVLAHYGLLPYPLADALIIGVSVSTVTAGAVTYMFGCYIGIALRAVSISRDAFEKLSATDTLTGLMNRRAFFDLYETAGPGSVFVIFDIDRFKRINDTFGHAAGDGVIRQVGKTLLDHLGPSSLAVARLGGEEFAVLFPADMRAGYADLVEFARRSVSRLVVDPDNPALHVTVSGGVAEVGEALDAFDAYKAADQALYFAKAAGRNRIVHVRDIPMLRPEIEAVTMLGDRAA